MNKKITVAVAFSTLFFASSAFSFHFAKKATATVCFTLTSSKNDCSQQVVNELTAAEVSIKIQAYQLTDEKIITALGIAKKRGVDIRVILDKTQKQAAEQLKFLNIPVWIDQKPKIAHNKIILIDDDIVATGSYNFTENANSKNAENLIFIVDRNLYRIYDKNFQSRLHESLKY